LPVIVRGVIALFFLFGALGCDLITNACGAHASRSSR
jgi:hypothetical protein